MRCFVYGYGVIAKKVKPYIVSPVPSSAEINEKADTVVEGSSITLFCNASGRPEPSVTWIKVGSSEILSNTSMLTVMNVSRPGTPEHMIQYQCTASNGVKSPAIAAANISVLCKSTLLSFSCSHELTYANITYSNCQSHMCFVLR